MNHLSMHLICSKRFGGGMIVRPWLKPIVQGFTFILFTAGHRRHRQAMT
ncbi:hypothetical protein [Haloferula sp.]